MPILTLPERVVLFGLAATPSKEENGKQQLGDVTGRVTLTRRMFDDVHVTRVEYPTFLVSLSEHRTDQRLVFLAAANARADQWLSTSYDARFRRFMLVAEKWKATVSTKAGRTLEMIVAD